MTRFIRMMIGGAIGYASAELLDGWLIALPLATYFIGMIVAYWHDYELEQW